MPDVQSLIQHLREDPTARERPPEELARQFGVDAGFVQMAITTMPKAAPAASSPTAPDEGSPWLDRCRAAWRRATDRPLAFVAVTMLGLCGLSVLHRLLTHVVDLPRGGVDVLFALFLSLVVTHFTVYFQQGRARVAFWGTGVFFIGMAVFALTRVSALTPQATVVGGLAVVIVTFVYMILGVPVTILGGYLRVARETKQERQLSRQEMLERLFEIRERLNAYPRPVRRQWREFPALAWMRRHLAVIAIASGLIVATASVVFMAIIDPTGALRAAPDRGPLQTMVFVMVGSVFLSGVSFVCSLGVGFLAGRALRGLGYGALYAAATYIPLFVPLPGQGWAAMLQVPWSTHVGTVLFTLMIPFVGGAMATIEEHSARKRALSENDPDTLMAEMLELEWKLRPSSRRICVMVVDVAGSTRLKEGADPFDAEWSFREYQSIVARVSNGHLGSVHSTAGDGAVVGFPDAVQALAAARAVYAEIAQFNEGRNRLAGPFRLRIGLHTGEVSGDLDQVQFTKVIDVAAHTEAACPVGSIAVSAPAAEELELTGIAPTSKLPDGTDVFVLEPDPESLDGVARKME